MFRRYNKVDVAPAPPRLELEPDEKLMKQKQRLEKNRKSVSAQELQDMQREAKRQERLLDVRMELHKRLLETLNLGALEKA